MISNNKIKWIKALHQKKYRDKEGLFIIEGKKIVEEVAAHHPHLIVELFCTNEIIDRLCIENVETPILISENDLKKISTLKTPPSVLAIVKKHSTDSNYAHYNEDLVLALDAVRDPGNLGTIIRMADWFGIKTVLCSPDCVECYNPKVVQATMGALFRTNILYGSLSDQLEKYRNHGYNVYGATLDGTNMYETALAKKSVMVMGNESNGICETTKQFLNKELFIPNYSNNSEKSESLNVSIATSVILAEFRRQQNYSK